jgi:hypothetical protein
MPFHGTPESLIARSDSKNPSLTCRGLTSNGRPCRRAISQTPGLSPSPQASPGRRRADDVEAFCWQHKEQATYAPSPSPTRRKGRSDVIREQNSVDSLVQKLGLVELEERQKEWVGRKAVALPDPDVPIPSIERDSPVKRKNKSSKKSISGSSWCCCGEIDGGYQKPRPVQSDASASPRKTAAVPGGNKVKVSHHLIPNHHTRPSIHRNASSRTGEFLALIPPTASPALTAQLLAELAKPFSNADEEGYIYMFWLTPESLPLKTPTRTASTLLAPPTNSPRYQRRTSDVLSDFSSTSPSQSNSSGKKTMLLKIGRAQNVHRRLNQWTRQCGYNLSLIRYYPYHHSPSNTSSSHSTHTLRNDGLPRTPRKVPNAARIERLIHIELAEKRVKGDGKCESCGREHREWFEVEASREGVKRVDEIIRRWVDWGEKQVAADK